VGIDTAADPAEADNPGRLSEAFQFGRSHPTKAIQYLVPEDRESHRMRVKFQHLDERYDLGGRKIYGRRGKRM
jgi:hypothetical protein